MILELQKEKIEHFKTSMAKLAPWMHHYKFDDSTYVGYYKLAGLGHDLTYCNEESTPEDIAAIKDNYENEKHEIWIDFLTSLFEQLNIESPGTKTVLDISSATGRNSIIAKDYGFGTVLSSEIRANQCQQQELIYDSLKDPKYRENIKVSNDTVSADSSEYVELYKDSQVDVVLSSGLLYHLANPIQHLMNLYRITDKYAIVYTMTHVEPNMETLWKLRLEEKDWITKATSSISMAPHFLGLCNYIKEIGFKSVQIAYPPIFDRNFPINNYSVRMFKLNRLLNSFGIKRGFFKNIDSQFLARLPVNPMYFAYLLEK